MTSVRITENGAQRLHLVRTEHLVAQAEERCAALLGERGEGVLVAGLGALEERVGALQQRVSALQQRQWAVRLPTPQTKARVAALNRLADAVASLLERRGASSFDD